MQQIGAADDTDELRAAHDGHALDAMFFHQRDDVVELGVFADGPTSAVITSSILRAWE